MFVFDSINQGLEFLACRDLEKAESMFLRIINDPYAQQNELKEARTYLNDIRTCQSGSASLDFDRYKKLSKKSSLSLDVIDEMLAEIYFSSAQTYREFDEILEGNIPRGINRLKQFNIKDIVARDKLFDQMGESGVCAIKQSIEKINKDKKGNLYIFDMYRWKTLFRKIIEQMNPLLLECHLELLDHILQTGEMNLLGDSKLTTLTPKYKWIIESTVRSKWFLQRSYFFKARSEIESQFSKKEGTRKHWEEVKYKKIKIFEECGFSEQNIQKFLYIDKLNYNTLEEIQQFSMGMGLTLVPREVSLALRDVNKSKDHIKERAGILMGQRKGFQDELLDLGFSNGSSYKIARQAKRSNSHQISDAFQTALKVARDEVYWYRIFPQSQALKDNIEAQCCKHLSTVRIHMFERGRLNKILLQEGKPLIRKYLIRIYGEEVVGLHCYFRLETVHQYYKLKFFEYHSKHVPSVSELIKISRKDFKPLIVDGYNAFIKKRRLNIPSSLYSAIEKHKSLTIWEDQYTTPEEKLLLKFWFMMDHGVNITQGLVQKETFSPGADLLADVKNQGAESKS
jgi:hypothetical protein